DCPAGSVLVTDRFSARLNPAGITTDVGEFEELLAQAAEAEALAGRTEALARAVGLYQGPLLAGFYENWIPAEQERLAERALRACLELAACREQAGELNGALEAVRQALTVDPLREEGHCELIRLLLAAGQPAAARRQYTQ